MRKQCRIAGYEGLLGRETPEWIQQDKLFKEK